MECLSSSRYHGDRVGTPSGAEQIVLESGYMSMPGRGVRVALGVLILFLCERPGMEMDCSEVADPRRVPIVWRLGFWGM